MAEGNSKRLPEIRSLKIYTIPFTSTSPLLFDESPRKHFIFTLSREKREDFLTLK
jgi:hypothetical protein